MGRASILLVVLVLAVALSAGPPARAGAGPPARAGAGPPTPLFGVSVNRIINDDFVPSHWDAPLSAVYASGLRVARTDAFWMWAERSAPVRGVHRYDWAWLDSVAKALASHRLRWLPILDYSAIWAASVPTDYHSPPRSNADYAAYARAFAARYGRGGAFWAQHPELPQLPVTDYEIWNEPNNARWFWRPKSDAARYADMYLRARTAIHSVDARATVVVGGLVARPSYVRAMYAARPDLRGNVDAIGWHAYAPRVSGLVNGVRDLRATLELVGARDLPVDITELGWPTSGKDPAVLTERARAVALEAAAARLARSDCGIRAVIAYTWRTPRRDATGFGIRRADGRPAPSSRAFERAATRYERNPGARLRLCHPPGTAEAMSSAVRVATGAVVTALT